ncbi:hypothetical protein ACQPZX_31070 [Actinoplanes sp. CA-142083]|uniref:hypothetical protein n=1 Tax=Actinoplanes sp. CA-142083 TaxID=3239903 RepID=UPI003D94B773
MSLFKKRAIAALSAIAAVLGVALFVAPPPLAGVGGAGYAGQRELSAALDQAFVDYWRAGGRSLSPELQQVVDYWFRFHVIRAVIAALLLAVLVALGVRLWTAFVRADRRRGGLAAGGVLVTMLGMFAVVVVMANVQGAFAPFSSLLPMLHGGLATGGQNRPAFATMVSDFGRYHWALAAVGVLVLIASLAAGVVAFMRARRADRSGRRVLRSFGVLAAAWSLLLALVVAANISTAANPEPALVAFFQGSW